VGTSANPVNVIYNWLLETAVAGVLTNGSVTLPAPTWNVVQPPPPPAGQPPAPPVVEAKIVAPDPVDPQRFGPAIWVKVFTTELEDAVGLEELVADNAKVKQAETEIEWQLLQRDPGNPDSGKLESGYGVPVGPNAASILRRYEFFKYAGPYDPETNEALVGSDSNPTPEELGIYLGAQNAALNLDVAQIPSPPGGRAPEPASAVLLLSGLGALRFSRRR
jgi:hypothetical protein